MIVNFILFLIVLLIFNLLFVMDILDIIFWILNLICWLDFLGNVFVISVCLFGVIVVEVILNLMDLIFGIVVGGFLFGV